MKVKNLLKTKVVGRHTWWQKCKLLVIKMVNENKVFISFLIFIEMNNTGDI